jgi:hypothetical protein
MQKPQVPNFQSSHSDVVPLQNLMLGKKSLLLSQQLQALSDVENTRTTSECSLYIMRSVQPGWRSLPNWLRFIVSA